MCKFSRQIILFTLLFLRLTLNAQNIGINDNGATPNVNAILDVDVTTNDKGILIPRLTTAQRTAIAGLGVGDEALTVYDTTTDSYWLWDGTQWIEFTMSGKAWELAGNTGTTAGTDFIGTTDAVDWVVKTNNTEQLRVLSGGNVGIGTTSPAVHLEVAGTNLTTSTIRSATYSADNQPAYFMFRKSRNATIGNHTILQGNDFIGSIRFAGSDGSSFLVGASIQGRVDGTPGVGSVPAEIAFQTSSTDKMVIRNSGMVGIGTSSPAARLQVAASSGENGLRVQINSSTKLYTTSNGGTSIGAFTAATTNGLRVAGDANIVGILSKGAGTFKIDHPLDPENKYLYHSFVESPDMMNIYNGNIITDANGNSTVELPDYFEALNMEFRYQLTVIGVFAQAIVLEEISNNKFQIKTNKPDVKVSWQVTGVRKDAFANKNRVVPEVEKEDELKGYYLHPLAFGLHENRSISNVKEEITIEEKKHTKVKEENAQE